MEYASKHDLNMVADNRPHQARAGGAGRGVRPGRGPRPPARSVHLRGSSPLRPLPERAAAHLLTCLACRSRGRVLRGSRLPCAAAKTPHSVPPSTRRQGLVLDCSPLEFEPMPELPAPAAAAAAGEGGGGGAAARLPVWLCLDEVMDPVRARGWAGARGRA